MIQNSKRYKGIHRHFCYNVIFAIIVSLNGAGVGIDLKLTSQNLCNFGAPGWLIW